MNGDHSPRNDGFNPFASASTAGIFGRSPVPTPIVSPPGSSWSVLHDLTDRDLKRFAGCGVFTDPKPLLGFLPRWILIVAIAAPIGGFHGWDQFHTVRLAALSALGTIALVLGLVVLFAAKYRRSARAAGFAIGRRITIADAGVWVDYPELPDMDRGTYLDRRRRRAEAPRTCRIVYIACLNEHAYSWQAFRSIEIRDDYLIMWLRSGRWLVIPVRAFESIEATEKFAGAAAGWIAESREGRATGG